jgi:hypothetical protein
MMAMTETQDLPTSFVWMPPKCPTTQLSSANDPDDSEMNKSTEFQIANDGQWREYRAKISAGLPSEGSVRVAAPIPSESYGDRISLALTEMRDIVENMVGSKLVGAPFEVCSFVDDDGDKTHLIILRVQIADVDAKTRAAVAGALLDFLARHEDKDVRNGVSVRVY